METGLSTLVTKDGFLINVPEKWNFKSLMNDPQNSIIDITKYPNRTGFLIFFLNEKRLIFLGITNEIWEGIKNTNGNQISTNNVIPTINKWNEKGNPTDYYLSSVILSDEITTVFIDILSVFTLIFIKNE